MFDEPVVEITKSIEGVEERKRSPTPDEEALAEMLKGLTIITVNLD